VLKSDFDNSNKMGTILLVGAPGFELGTSCAQASGAISWKSFLFNLVFENKPVRKIFGSGQMYQNVAPHAWSPPIFPSAKKQRNAFIDARLLRNTNPSVERRKRLALFAPIWIVCRDPVTGMSHNEGWSDRTIRAALFATTVCATVALGVQRCLKPLSVHWPSVVLRPHTRKADNSSQCQET
jgi:hypothetical protein